MTRKEINEIKSQFNIEDCGILRLCGCYVDGEKNKVTAFNETFLNLPEEERHKYLDILKKCLSGTPGKNLIDMKFTLDAYGKDKPRDFLLELKKCELKDDSLLNRLYDNIIANYYYPGNYLILLVNQTYDVPGVTEDNIGMEDASDEVYSYILCCICPVTLSKAGLGYFETDKAFHNQTQSHMVDNPDIAFLFPAFNNRSADDESILFHSKDTDDFQQNFLNAVLSCEIPLPANVQKETFNNLVTETLGTDCSYETVKNIHENLNELIEEHKSISSAPVMLDKTEVKEILEKSGVANERLTDFEEHFEMAAGENGRLAATNITPSRKFEVKTPDVVIKINPDKTDLVETRMIDGKQCLVIQIDERLEVNGISVNPDTGEVIDRTPEE